MQHEYLLPEEIDKHVRNILTHEKSECKDNEISKAIDNYLHEKEELANDVYMFTLKRVDILNKTFIKLGNLEMHTHTPEVYNPIQKRIRESVMTLSPLAKMETERKQIKTYKDQENCLHFKYTEFIVGLKARLASKFNDWWNDDEYISKEDNRILQKKIRDLSFYFSIASGDPVKNKSIKKYRNIMSLVKNGFSFNRKAPKTKTSTGDIDWSSIQKKGEFDIDKVDWSTVYPKYSRCKPKFNDETIKRWESGDFLNDDDARAYMEAFHPKTAFLHTHDNFVSKVKR